MRLTREHGEAFAYWRTPPRLRVLTKMKAPHIHRLVNEHAGLRNTEVGVNALALVTLRMRNGMPAAQALAPSAWDLAQVPKRYYAIKRWQRNLHRSLERKES